MHNRIEEAQIEVFRAPSTDPIVSGTLTGKPEDLLATEIALNHVGDIRAHITVLVDAGKTQRTQCMLPNKMRALVRSVPSVSAIDRVQSFMHELFDLYDRHNLAISHEDEHGAFVIKNKSDLLADWMRDASIDTEVKATEAVEERFIPQHPTQRKDADTNVP